MDPRPGILREMSAALEDILAALGADGASGRGGALDAALLRSDLATLRLREAEAQLGPGDHSSSLEVQREVEALSRLQALVLSVAGEARSEVGQEREKLGQLRTALRQHAPQERVDSAGNSCDVRG